MREDLVSPTAFDYHRATRTVRDQQLARPGLLLDYTAAKTSSNRSMSAQWKVAQLEGRAIELTSERMRELQRGVTARGL